MNFVTRLFAPLVVAVLFSGGVSAQSAVRQTAALALKGYDVVAYFSENRPVQGMPDVWEDFDGQRYLFSSARNRAAFNANPDRFLPSFGGYCAMGVSKGKKFDADPTVFRIVDGRLYVFSSPRAGDASDQDPEVLAAARRAWQTLK